MLTMYEKLMTLPIFKGIGPDQMSLFLEKTNLEFKTYSKGDIIISNGEACDGLVCLLTGSVTISKIINGGPVRIDVDYGAGAIFGLDRLYGMETSYSFTVTAQDDCGTMSFSKSQYLRLIKENDICLINFLNHLSFRAQRLDMTLDSGFPNSLSGVLAIVVSLFSDRNCGKITIYGLPEICAPMSHELTEYDKNISEYEASGLMERNPDGSLTIQSRRSFLEKTACSDY